MGVSCLLSESKLSSFFTELSSVLEAEEIPESDEVGLCSGEILSVRIYLGVQPEMEKCFCNLTNATVKQPVAKMPEAMYLCFVCNHLGFSQVQATLQDSCCWGREMGEKTGREKNQESSPALVFLPSSVTPMPLQKLHQTSKH